MRKYKIEETAYFKPEGVFYSDKHDEVLVKYNGKLEGRWAVVFALQHAFLSDYNLWDFIYIGDL